MSYRVPNSVWYCFPGPLAPEIAIIKFLDDHVHCHPRDYNTLHNFAFFHNRFFIIRYNFMFSWDKLCHDTIFGVVVLDFSLKAHFTINSLFFLKRYWLQSVILQVV